MLDPLAPTLVEDEDALLEVNVITPCDTINSPTAETGPLITILPIRAIPLHPAATESGPIVNVPPFVPKVPPALVFALMDTDPVKEQLLLSRIWMSPFPASPLTALVTVIGLETVLPLSSLSWLADPLIVQVPVPSALLLVISR